MELRQLPPRAAVMQRAGPVDLQKVVKGMIHPALERVAVVPVPELAASVRIHASSPHSFADEAWSQLNCRRPAPNPWCTPHAWCTRAHPNEADQQPVLVGEQQQRQGGGSCTHPLARGRWQRFFSLYIKAPPSGRMPADSLFCGHAVHSEVDLTGEFAQFAVVQAEVDLMAVALEDPMNLQFVVISEASVPVRPPELFWAQLMWETKSRVNACGRSTFKSRWHPAMETDSLKPWHWRKSSQWISLTRAHAALAAADQHVIEVFRRYCYVGLKVMPSDRYTPDSIAACLRNRDRARHALLKTHLPAIDNCTFGGGLQAVTELLAGSGGRQWAESQEPAACHDFLKHLYYLGHGRLCVSDEHYFGTLLASYQLEHQADCYGGAHYLEQGRGWHPHTFKPEDFNLSTASPDRFLNARSHTSCDGIEAMRSLQGLFHPIPCEAATSGNSGGRLSQRVTFRQKQDTKQQHDGSNSGSHHHTAHLAQRRQHKRRQSQRGVDQQVQPKRRRLMDDRQQGQQGKRQLEEQQKQVTLSSWLEDTIGFKPMDATCPVAMRKVVADAADVAFRFFVECDGGMGLGARCNWA